MWVCGDEASAGVHAQRIRSSASAPRRIAPAPPACAPRPPANRRRQDSETQLKFGLHAGSRQCLYARQTVILVRLGVALQEANTKEAQGVRTRAGTYQRQPTGYRAFAPAPLPPEPPVDLSGRLRGLLSEANLALGRLDGSILTLPNPDRFVFMYVRKEAVLSSQIEGTQSSLQDLLAAEAQLYPPDAPNDVDEVVNYLAAMNHGLARLRELPVSMRLIREIHEKLLDGVRGSHLTPGELRRTQNWIGPTGCTLNEATFVPPPPQVVPEALGAWKNFCTERATCRS